MSQPQFDSYKLSLASLQRLFEHFHSNSYENIGPIQRDGAIMIEELEQFEDLPRGFYEKVDKGSYRLYNKDDGTFFQYTIGPQSFKKFIHPVRRRLWSATGSGSDFKVEEETPEFIPKVFWGVRSCDLNAIGVFDNVFNKQEFKNNYFDNVRKDLTIVAVNCGNPNSNCFCSSMGTGPKAKKNFDFSLTEIINESEHYFLCECGNEEAVKLCKELGFKPAEKENFLYAEEILKAAKNKMEKSLDPKAAAQIIKNNSEHKHWLDVSDRCLACANCTMVCPTCFCTASEDITDLSGDHTERWLRWDSCFHGDYSYIHGGVIRHSIKSRYRQWMSHKLSNWYDQFGTSGCVGCGRCISWCPVGIDITEEVKALQN